MASPPGGGRSAAMTNDPAPHGHPPGQFHPPTLSVPATPYVSTPNRHRPVTGGPMQYALLVYGRHDTANAAERAMNPAAAR